MDRRHYLKVRALAREVKSRTGADGYIDLIGGALQFGYKRPDDDVAICMIRDLYKQGCRNAPWCGDPATDGEGVEDLVYEIQLGKVDPKLKRAWRKVWKARADQDKQLAKDNALASAEEQARERFAHARERAAMGKHYRGSAVVDGLRE